MLCGAPRPQTPPGRTRRLGGRAGAGRRAGRPPGRARGGAAGSSPSARLGPGAHPELGGDGSVSRLALCAAPARKRAGGCRAVLARLERRDGGGSQPGAPPRLARRAHRRRRCRRYRGLAAAAASSDFGSAARPPFLLRPGCGDGGGSPSPGAGVDESARSQGAPGPLAIRPGALPGSGAPSFFFRCRRGRRSRDREAGEGARVLGYRRCPRSSPSPLAVRTPRAQPRLPPRLADPHPGWRRAALPGQGRAAGRP